MHHLPTFPGVRVFSHLDRIVVDVVAQAKTREQGACRVRRERGRGNSNTHARLPERCEYERDLRMQLQDTLSLLIIDLCRGAPLEAAHWPI